MTKEEIFKYFLSNSANLEIKSTLMIMLGALLIGAIIYYTYYISYKGVAYNNKFNISLVITLLISVVIMLMISSNIVISLGMVGALSIVRFRTAIKDSRDTVFIFWAIAEGLSVGSLNFKLAIITTLFIAIFIILTSRFPKVFNKYLLIVNGNEKTIDISKLTEKLDSFIVDCKLRNAVRSESTQELIFEIKTKGELNLDIINSLMAVEGVKSVNWISESGETLG